MKKIANVITVIAVIYGCAFISYELINRKYIPNIFNPIELFIKEGVKSNFQNLLYPGNVRKTPKISGINELQFDVNLLHITPDFNLGVLNLRDTSFKKILKLPQEVSNDLMHEHGFMYLQSTNSPKHLFISGWGGHSISKINLVSGQLVKSEKFPFQFHHRLNLNDSVVFTTVRKESDRYNFLKEGIAIFNYNLELLDTVWMDDILTKHEVLNDLQYIDGRDAYHINDVEVYNGKNYKYLKFGDIFISSRNMSTIFQLRKMNNNYKIYKKFQGGFNLQHDIDILDSNTISCFNNNSITHFQGLNTDSSEYVCLSLDHDTSWVKIKLPFMTAWQGQCIQLNDSTFLFENQDQWRFVIMENGEVVYDDHVTFGARFIQDISWTPLFIEY